jgi:hypothetical protein
MKKMIYLNKCNSYLFGFEIFNIRKVVEILAVNMEDAKRVAEIHSIYGLEKGIEDKELKIKEKEYDHLEVSEGRKWNPLMKKGNMKELEKDIASLREEIELYKEALKIKAPFEKGL